MDEYDLIADEITERFGLFDKLRERWHEHRAESAEERAERHQDKAQQIRHHIAEENREDHPRMRRHRYPLPRRHMRRADYEALMDERDGRPPRLRRRRRRPVYSW